MRLARPALIILPLVAAALYFANTAPATPAERAVLTVVGRELLNRRMYGTCLATWTSGRFYPGPYGLGGGGTRPDLAWLDRFGQAARSRAVSLYVGAPDSARPIWVDLTLDQLIGCDRPIRLTTPAFVGDLAFVTARLPGLRSGWSGSGETYVLRRTGTIWRIIGGSSWGEGAVASGPSLQPTLRRAIG